MTFVWSLIRKTSSTTPFTRSVTPADPADWTTDPRRERSRRWVWGLSLFRIQRRFSIVEIENYPASEMRSFEVGLDT
ncbi:MAG: hypothetical protein Q9N34_00755 [Aquificota bacterium]|nr:hypothetical protein [Aquificota bacterium]